MNHQEHRKGQYCHAFHGNFEPQDITDVSGTRNHLPTETWLSLSKLTMQCRFRENTCTQCTVLRLTLQHQSRQTSRERLHFIYLELPLD